MNKQHSVEEIWCIELTGLLFYCNFVVVLFSTIVYMEDCSAVTVNDSFRVCMIRSNTMFRLPELIMPARLAQFCMAPLHTFFIVIDPQLVARQEGPSEGLVSVQYSPHGDRQMV